MTSPKGIRVTLIPFGDVTNAGINNIKVQQKAFNVDKTYVKPICGFYFLNKSNLRQIDFA